jgi:hypothetical protein
LEARRLSHTRSWSRGSHVPCLSHILVARDRRSETQCLSVSRLGRACRRHRSIGDLQVRNASFVADRQQVGIEDTV